MVEEIIIPKNYNARAHYARSYTKKFDLQKNDNLHSEMVHKLEDFEFVVLFEDDMSNRHEGARQAMNKLQQLAYNGEFSHLQSIDTFIHAKRYFIFSTRKHESMTDLQDTMCRCNLERLVGKCVGCLVLNDFTYVFFWQKNA